MTNPISFDSVVEAAEGLTRLATKLGERAQLVNHWRYRGFPRDRCPGIERACLGRVTCEDLRPDVAWVRVSDPNWPWHPKGRPLIDVASVHLQREAA